MANHKIKNIDSLKKESKILSVINFQDESKQLEIKIGFSFVNIENAKANLEKEISGMSFSQVRKKVTRTWKELLSKVIVSGGTVLNVKKCCSILPYTVLFYGPPYGVMLMVISLTGQGKM